MSLVPGCVSAEPDGFAYGELRETLTAIAERVDVVGFDFVEVNPQLDVPTGVTSYLGAQTIIARGSKRTLNTPRQYAIAAESGARRIPITSGTIG